MAVRYRSTACDAEARALVATTGALVPQRSVHCTKPLAPQRSAFRPLLSHKSLQYHRPELAREINSKKRESQLLETLSKKVAMTYSPTNLCSTIGPS